MLGWRARRFAERRAAMSTFVAVTVEDRSAARAQEAIGRAFEEMERVASLLTRFEVGSALGVLNADGRLAAPAAFVLGVAGGLRLLETLRGAAGVLLTTSGERRASARWRPASCPGGTPG